MIDLLTGNLSTVIGGVVALLAGVFGVAFKLRGSAIKQLEADKKVGQMNNQKLKDEIAINEATNELHKEQAKIDETVIKSGADVNRERMSQHFTRD